MERITRRSLPLLMLAVASCTEGSEAPETNTAATEDAGSADDGAGDGADVGEAIDAGPLAEGSDAGTELDGEVDPAVDAGSSLCGALAANGDALLELGPTWTPRRLWLTDTRIVSTSSSDWVLWDRGTRTELASGPLPCVLRYQTACYAADIAFGGELFAIQLASELELRSTTTGAVVGRIPFDSELAASAGRFGVAADGSYVWTGSASQLQIWSPTGEPVASHPGNYASADVVAVPGKLLVAAGPTGGRIIEQVDASTGEGTLQPAFLGDFAGWFRDGTRFLTTSGTAVRVYSATAVQQKLLEIPNVTALGRGTGYGDFFWFGGQLFQVTGGAQPLATSSVLMDSNGWLLDASSPPRLFDVRGPALATSTAVAPEHDVASADGFSAAPFAATPDGDLALTRNGALFVRSAGEAAFARHNCGRVLDLAPSAGARFALSVTDEVWVVDTGDRSIVRSWSELGTASKLALSGDGSLLAWYGAGGEPVLSGPARSVLKLLDVATGALVNEWGTTGPLLSDFDLAADGSRVALTWDVSDPTSTGLTIASPDGNTTYFTRAGRTLAARLGPSERSAVAGTGLTPTTLLYQGTALTGAVDGTPAGWLDEARLLIKASSTQNGYDDAAVVDPAGAVQARLAFIAPSAFDDLAGSRIFSATSDGGGNIYDVASGDSLWSAPPSTSFQGAANDELVLYTTRTRLVAAAP